MMTDEIGVTRMQTKELGRLTTTIRSKETRRDSLLHVSKGAWPSQHLDFGPEFDTFNFLLQNSEAINFCCLKLPSFLYLVTVAPEN